MHTTIFAASTGLWNLELIRQAHAPPVVPRENRVRMSTVRGARSIPSTLRPRALVTQFPRLANTMADVWSQPKVFHMLLCQLMADDRGRRSGFPIEVRRDLIKLRVYSDRTHKPSYATK